MSWGERPLLETALAAGSRVFWALAAQGPDAPLGLEKSRSFLFRRWVLEALLVLRIQGDSSYNALALALGRPAGGSISPKLAALCEAGLAARTEKAPAPKRVVYSLTPAGRSLADGVYTLTRWKGLLARAAEDPTAQLPTFPDFGRPPERGEGDLRGAFGRYVEATAAIALAREKVCRPTEFEDGIATARRFSGAWVHKWHTQLLTALALGGPQSFSDLRRRLKAGDQALSVALGALAELRSIEPALDLQGKRYALARLGWADLALSAPLGVILAQAQGPGTGSARSTGTDLPLQAR